jgi:4-carboxymuconolactone decarboxylase
MARVSQITDKSQVPVEHHDTVDNVLEVFGDIRGPHTVLLLSPPVEAQVIGLARFFRSDATLVRSPLRELAAITVAREKDSLYVWAAQVANARREGLSEATIAAIRDKQDRAVLAPEEAEVVGYVQQLLRTNCVDQSAFDALRDRHGVPWLVELTAVIGYFGLLTGVVNAFEVPAAPGGDALPVA